MLLRVIFGVCATASLVACVQTKPEESLSFVAPPMQWDHHPEAEEWTESTLVALSTKDQLLSERVPADIETWCPGYRTASVEERRAFWAGLLSAVAKYESTWNERASGGGGRWIGLMQIDLRSAANYGCEATSVGALKDGEANLECAVEIMSTQVAKDGLVAGGGNRGIGRDWAPLRSSEKRSAMAAWTSQQPYCQAT
ncbi:transglycosylase SLT domain-containing protein [Tabrizicola sp.]|uniref:transglycosylase SLT domain-containing protein n=1 Tax=Tabrizicola sp. TaxID=2005166 RepID=UPI0027363C81|nr:transglycosylase SLT domain-containing protein [Tabrizicola sp.]MDP3197095.1 transglycosylase SLT domain-containing protein [Tabrizicola sp.]